MSHKMFENYQLPLCRSQSHRAEAAVGEPVSPYPLCGGIVERPVGREGACYAWVGQVPVSLSFLLQPPLQSAAHSLLHLALVRTEKLWGGSRKRNQCESLCVCQDT